MARSRLLLVGVGALAASALACDSLLGLGSYNEVDGSDSGTGAQDSGIDAMDSGFTIPTPDAADAADALDAGDADVGDASITIDGSVGPPLLERWAQWHMPNPDAAIAPGADASLPNPMTYDAGADGGAATVFDLRTHLVWSRADFMAGDFTSAAGACAALGTGWHVPTRIELVSLIDFTQQPTTIDPVAFPTTHAAAYWTSSDIPMDGSTGYWTVSFDTGLTQPNGTGSYVRCVEGGP